MAPGKRRTPSEAVKAAIARGALTPERGQFYLAKAADTGRGDEVRDLVDKLWGPGTPVVASWLEDLTDEDRDVMAKLWPDEPPPGPGREPDRLQQVDVRQGYLRSQAAAGDSGGGEIVDHGRTTVTAHEHAHSDYGSPAGVHSHLHAHADDANHRPGEGHQHQLAAAMGDPAVRAGISRRAAEHAAAEARQRRVWEMTDDELLDSLGPPPGRW
jgi:hypothetical protein